MAMKVKVVKKLKGAVFTPTTGNTAFANAIIKSLDELSKERKAWEMGAYKKSNDGLYSLMAHSLDVFSAKFMTGTDDDRKTLRLELSSRLKADNIKVQRNTTTLTMFVRFIFQSDRKRAHGYQYVLKAAISHGVPSIKLAEWLAEQGGIEEVRRKMIVSEKALKNQADRAEAVDKVKSNAELALINPMASVQLDVPVKYGEYAVMVGKPDESGVISIIAVLCNAEANVVDAIYKRIGKERLEDDTESASIAAEMKGLKPSTEAANDPVKQQLAA